MSSATGVLLSSPCSKQIGSRRYLRVHRAIRGLIKVEGSTWRSGFFPDREEASGAAKRGAVSVINRVRQFAANDRRT